MAHFDTSSPLRSNIAVRTPRSRRAKVGPKSERNERSFVRSFVRRQTTKRGHKIRPGLIQILKTGEENSLAATEEGGREGGRALHAIALAPDTFECMGAEIVTRRMARTVSAP